MFVYGKERHFRMSVGASCKLADLCPQGDLSRLEEVIQKDFKHSVVTAAKLIVILNEGYCEYQRFSGGEPEEPLTVDEVLALSPSEFGQLQQEAVAEFQGGSQTTVAVEPSKKNKERA